MRCSIIPLCTLENSGKVTKPRKSCFDRALAFVCNTKVVHFIPKTVVLDYPFYSASNPVELPSGSVIYQVIA